MSIKLEISNVNHNKLYDEMITAKIEIKLAERPSDTIGSSVFYFADGTDIQLVQQIIDEHDTAPLPRPLSDIEKLRLEQAQANSELVQLIMMMGGA